jgi:hypothetical protein
MIRQKRHPSQYISDEKMHEKLLPSFEIKTYDYDQKHVQAPSA